MLTLFCTILGSVRRFVRDELGSSALETGVVVGGAVVVATALAAGLGSSGVDSSRETQSQVNNGISASSIVLTSIGDTRVSSVEITPVAGQATVVDDKVGSIAAGDTSRAVDKVTVLVKNDASDAFDLSTVQINYTDGTQHQLLNDPSADPGAVDSDTLTFGAATFTWQAGSPYGDSSASAGSQKAAPSIKAGDIVEITVDISGLTNRLTTNSEFAIEIKSQVGQPFNIKERTPAGLQGMMEL